MNPNTVFAWITAIVCTAFSLLILLATLFLLIASAPNSSERQLDVLKACGLAVAVASALGLGCGAWLIITGKPWLAAACCAVPGVVSLIALAVPRYSER